MPSLENKYNHQGLVSRKSSLSVPQDQNRHVCIRNYSSSFCEKKASNTSLASERFVVKQEKSRPSGDSLEVVGMGSTVKSPVGSFKSGLSLCMWWIHFLIALAVASTVGGRRYLLTQPLHQGAGLSCKVMEEALLECLGVLEVVERHRCQYSAVTLTVPVETGFLALAICAIMPTQMSPMVKA